MLTSTIYNFGRLTKRLGTEMQWVKAFPIDDSGHRWLDIDFGQSCFENLERLENPENLENRTPGDAAYIASDQYESAGL